MVQALLAGTATPLITPAQLVAQESAAKDETASHEERIIVVGQKTKQTLLATQSRGAVVAAEDIREKDLTSSREAFRTMDNVIDADFVDAGFIIRGINSEGLTPGGAPLAAIYIDGAEQTGQGARRGARGLWDVQQVEVYRGPQSTLSCRAAPRWPARLMA